MDCSKPFLTPADFLENLAALSAMHGDAVKKIVRSTNRPLWRLLWCAGAPGRLQWLFNNIRMRHAMDRRMLGLLPSGTTSNEALHFEINSWFKQTQSVHKATLRLKLLVMGTAKLISHDAAMRFPTARQVAPAVVLARCVTRPVWSCTEWKRWCSQLDGRKRKAKALLPMQADRETDIAIVKGWVQRKPASAYKRPAADPARTKRTPFNRKRVGSFRKGGTKNTCYRGG
jgi:hypothetical protein